jgi:hypothetical protein
VSRNELCASFRIFRVAETYRLWQLNDLAIRESLDDSLTEAVMFGPDVSEIAPP